MTPESKTEPLVSLLTVRVDAANAPLFVALDGRSGAGKSTLASVSKSLLAEQDVVMNVIEGDQFYAGGSSQTWDSRSDADKVANAMDWRRQHTLLAELRVAGEAAWRSFDWEAPDWDAEPAPLESRTQRLSLAGVAIVMLEGAYSARPELHEHLDLLVLLDPPADIRRQQLLDREGDAYRADWEGRWSEAEDIYFSEIMTRNKFDLVID